MMFSFFILLPILLNIVKSGFAPNRNNVPSLNDVQNLLPTAKDIKNALPSTNNIKNGLRFTNNIKNQLPFMNVKDSLSFIDIYSMNIPGLQLPNINIEKPESLAKLPSFNEIKNNVTDIPTSVLDKIKGELTDFFTEQISMFKNVKLSVFNDFEKVVEFKLELPDFNLLNLFPDLNEKVTIKLYTKESGDKYDILEADNKTELEQSRFDTNRYTYIITHGFMASSDGLSCTLVRDALLNTTDSNVITVNWSPLSTGSYSIARYYVSNVGEHIGKLINFLYENGLNPDMTTLIGHSLGAQVMGFAGQIANPKVNHTIGLDPAWPLFVFLPADQRLSPEDAQHVEVLHTNGGLLGVPSVTGHYDFYPNGGFFQKGCLQDIFSACSHGRSYRYLSEQIKHSDPCFYSLKCDSYSEFGKGQCPNGTAFMGGINFFPAEQGVYYLHTKENEPFSLIGKVARL